MSLDWYLAMFDPYRKWLGILPKDQPPNCYRLLSLELFENDLDVIEAAVDRTMGFIRQYQSGEHATEAATLLNEIARARLCLLKPESKADYDSKLKLEIGGKQDLNSAADASEVDWTAVDLTALPRQPSVPKRKKSKKKVSASNQWVVGIVVAVLILVIALPYLRSNSSKPTSDPAQIPPLANNASKSDVAEDKNASQPVAVTSIPSASSVPTVKTEQAVAEPTKTDVPEQTKSEVAEKTKPEVATVDTPVPSTPSPPAETKSRFDPATMINRFPHGDMEFAGADFKKAFVMVTPDHKPFKISRWTKDPHSGNACLHFSGHIFGKEQWACIKLMKMDVPPGKTIHGSMWRRADRGTGNFVLGGKQTKGPGITKEFYGSTGKDWEETHWTLTPKDLENVTELDIELVTSKEFDVYVDDICVWIE